MAETVRKVAQMAIGATGNIPESCTYSVKADSVEDPATGAVTATSTDYTAIPVVFDEYTEYERMNPQVLATDMKGYIARLDLEITPGKGDVITRPGGGIVRVVKWKTDPAAALWILQLRAG